MKGNRIESPFAANGALIGEWPKPGDFYFYPESGWCGVTPNGLMVGLRKHEVTEHEDRTITVSPSILASGKPEFSEGGFMIRANEWHGYLEHGVWREA